MKIVHVGCGRDIIPGAINIDYIRAFKYINHPTIAYMLYRIGFLNREGYRLVKELYPERDVIKWGRATKLPVKNEEADVVYSCHMMEHLTHEDAEKFLCEVYRILKGGGYFA